MIEKFGRLPPAGVYDSGRVGYLSNIYWVSASFPPANFVDAAGLYLHSNTRNRLTKSKIDI
jgi:hypothetical protein